MKKKKLLKFFWIIIGLLVIISMVAWSISLTFL